MWPEIRLQKPVMEQSHCNQPTESVCSMTKARSLSSAWPDSHATDNTNQNHSKKIMNLGNNSVKLGETQEYINYYYNETKVPD